MKVRNGRTYLTGVERAVAEAALEDRAWEILGRVLLFPPAKRPPRRRKKNVEVPKGRKKIPAIKGRTEWCPFGSDLPGIPVRLDTGITDERIQRAIKTLFPDGPFADGLYRFIQRERELIKGGIHASKFPGTIDRWFRFLLSKEGTEVAGIPAPTGPIRTVTIPDEQSEGGFRTVKISPLHNPMSDEAIISITESLLREWGVRFKHSVLRQYLVGTRKSL
ncbi:MAG: hypothetical protein A2W09_01555 [Deltaproteobacteria bacterium RBG_16_50_11]|nr:MAG: hypothetical protein A2W09_01555 [Deltaproteobacteria bacterium RBG_16_50_11]